MTIDRIKKYLENAEYAQDTYFNTKAKCSHIARALKLSECTVSKMIDKKYPKAVQKYLEESKINYQI